MRKILVVLILFPGFAWAQIPLLGSSNPPSFGGPGNIATFTAWWGLRGYSSAQCTGSVRALTLRRASDGTTADINILSSCDLDVATAATFCDATTCSVAEICNQVASDDCSGTHDLVQGTAANQPAFIFNCLGTHPCLESTAATQILVSATNVTPATGTASFAATSARTAGTGGCTLVRENGNANRVLTALATLVMRLSGGASGTIDTGQVGAGFHAVTAALNGASSVINADGAETPGSATGSTGAGTPAGFNGAASTTCRHLEAGFIDNTAFSGPVRQTLVSASRGYWGF